MSTSSTRAQAIAEILWQLKKAEKLATLTSIAARAGFSPGSGGRTVSTCLKIVRRDWPHLQWWRAVADNGQLDEEQRSFLAKAGFETETVEGGGVVVKSFATQLMSWEVREDRLDDGDSQTPEVAVVPLLPRDRMHYPTPRTTRFPASEIGSAIFGSLMR